MKRFSFSLFHLYFASSFVLAGFQVHPLQKDLAVQVTRNRKEVLG